MSEKRLKTPLRYPGGKSRAMKYLFSDENMPKNEIKEYREGFIGGGSPAIAFTKANPDVPVWINDKYFNLYKFWTVLRDRGDELADFLIRFKEDHGDDVEKHRESFLLHKEEITTCGTDFGIAWRFFFLNKSSFSGLGESSGFSKLACNANFNMSTIEALRYYSSLIKNWKITNDDYSTLLDDNPNAFVFLDPPYQDIGKGNADALYGKGGSMHKSFNHYEFCQKASDCGNMVMITYNSNPTLREWLGDWDQVEWDLTYTMRSNNQEYRETQGERKELLCMNYERIKTNYFEDIFE